LRPTPKQGYKEIMRGKLLPDSAKTCKEVTGPPLRSKPSARNWMRHSLRLQPFSVHWRAWHDSVAARLLPPGPTIVISCEKLIFNRAGGQQKFYPGVGASSPFSCALGYPRQACAEDLASRPAS